MSDIVEYLEPYMIYSNDLTYDTIDIIEDVIESNILYYKQDHMKTDNQIEYYLNRHKNIGNTLNPSIYFNLFPNEGEEFSKSKEIFNKIYYD